MPFLNSLGRAKEDRELGIALTCGDVDKSDRDQRINRKHAVSHWVQAGIPAARILAEETRGAADRTFGERGNSTPRSNLTTTSSYMTSSLSTLILTLRPPRWPLQGHRRLEKGNQGHLRIRRTKRRSTGGALWRREEFIACDARGIALTKGLLLHFCHFFCVI